MSGLDPQVLGVLMLAAEGDPKVEAELRTAHAERGTAFELFQLGNFDDSKRHVLAALGATDDVVALWEAQGRNTINGDVVKFGAILREDLALVMFRLEEPVDDVLEMLQLALRLHEQIDPKSEDVARCLSSLADTYEQSGDPETARVYFQRALELGD
jgi:tetratricopeptide (TPR) repeat protein